MLVNLKDLSQTHLLADTNLASMNGVVEATLMGAMILSKASVKMDFQPKASSRTEEPDFSVADSSSEPNRASSS